MGYTLYVDWLKKEIQVTDREYGMCPEEEELNRMAMSDREANWDELITIDEKMDWPNFIEQCGEMGVPATRKNWAKFKEHRQRVLAQWDKLTDERLARNGAGEVFAKERHRGTSDEF